MKDKFINYYMDVAIRTAQLSYATKLKVGAVLVKNDNILGFSYNGSYSGDDNCAEYKVYSHEENYAYGNYPYEEIINGIRRTYRLQTKPNVFHAEENLILKLSRSHESSENGIMFITHSPCYICSRLIKGAKIKEVYYLNDYRDSSGIEFLTNAGVEVHKCKMK